MSITDELRKWAHEHVVYGMQTTLKPPAHPLTFGTKEEVLSIADRIDAEHKKSVMDALYDALFYANEDDMAELGWVRLPKDADGVPNHAPTTEDVLKPCPFCGGRANLEQEGGRMGEELKSCPWCESTHGIRFEGRPTLLGTEWRLVHSTERCPMRVETEWYRSRDEAIAAWNGRADAWAKS